MRMAVNIKCYGGGASGMYISQAAVQRDVLETEKPASFAANYREAKKKKGKKKEKRETGCDVTFEVKPGSKERKREREEEKAALHPEVSGKIRVMPESENRQLLFAEGKQ